MAMGHIQIPDALFLALCQYHLGDDASKGDEIKKGLREKMEALLRREAYRRYKNRQDEESRQAYLDLAGIPDEERWE